MSNSRDPLAKLTPKQRALYELLLKEKKDQRQAASTGAEKHAIPKRQGSGPAPASFSQQRLWVLEQLEGGLSPAYNVHITVQFTGALDLALVERCVNAVVRRHESLRTVFATADDGMPVQVVQPEQRLLIPVEDVSHLSKEEQDAEVERRTREESQRTFDLTRGPLLRGKVLRLGPDNHVALVTMHHLVTDRWSLGVFVRELMAFYAAEVTGQPPALPELAIQYSDYAAWQRERMTGERLRQEVDFWVEHLGTLPPPLELPTDRPRPPEQTYRGSRQFVTLPVALTRALKDVSQQEGATLFMTLLAGFQALLHRYSGQTDITVGSPIAGRQVPELETLIGFFVNMLVLRNRLDGAPTFRELLRRAKDVCTSAYAHQELPFEKLVEELQPPRDLSRHPLFQVVFSFQNTPRQDLAIPGLRSTYLLVDPGSAKFDLLLELREDRPDEIFGWFEYNTDLFDTATIQQLRGHYYTLLEAVAASPDTRLHELPLLDVEERRQLLVTWNDTARVQDALPVHLQFEAQAARTPDAPALSFAGGQLSYRELHQRVLRLSGRLRALGVHADAPVGLCARRSADMVVGMLAILHAGGAYLPLDPAYPPKRLELMLRDSGARVLLTQSDLTELLPTDGLRVLRFEEAADAPAAEAPGAALPEGLAYVIYTSGSTGTPKGVMVPHRTVATFLGAMDSRLGDSAPGTGTWLAVTSISFDIHVLELLWTLCRGFHVVLHDAQAAARTDTAPSLPELLGQHAITHLQCTPAFARALVLAPESVASLGTLRHLLVGGEALAGPLAARLRAALPAAALTNMYGPTETTVWSSTYRVPAGELPATVSIGGPISNTRLYVLDARGQPVPVGVPGELFIAGGGVVRGYHQRPDLTAERFVPDPFQGVPGARMYRTGDLARWRRDGTLDFLGRTDFQVKVRGFRIELGEVEATLARHPDVRQAVAGVHRDSAGDGRLVAWLVPQPGSTVDPVALREWTRQHLPEHLVPSWVLPLEALPLTPNGKVDRKALPAPDAARLERQAHVAPRTPTEALLAGVFSQVLGVERVGVHDSFFELGGHSLLATQAVARLRTELGVDVPLRELFDAPSIGQLAPRVEARRQAQRRDGALLAPRPVPRTGDPVLSFSQQRLWFLDQLEPGGTSYNLPAAVRLRGTLDVPALERAFTELVRRHETLRTTFREDREGPVQVIHAPAALPLTVVDLEALEPEAREAELPRLAARELQHAFDLRHGPLLRVTLLRFSEQQHVLLLLMHHIVSDGWSMGVLVREAVALYNAFAAGQPSPLPELPLHYADFAVWQRESLQGETLEAQRAWWRGHLEGAPHALELPTDLPRPSMPTFQGASVPVRLSPQVSASLRAFCQEQDVTPFMALLGTFQAFLARYSGQGDFITGTPIAGRRFVELEGLIGFFANTLAMRARLDGQPSFQRLMVDVREATLGAYANQELPFEKLVEELQPTRDLSRSPLFQVFFVLQNAPLPSVSGEGLSIQPLELDTLSAKFDLELNLSEAPDGFSGTLVYSTDLFLPATARRMARLYVHFVEALLAAPQQPLHRLPLMPEQELRTILVDFNRSAVSFPSEVTIPEVFSRVAAAHGDVVALEFGTQRLTYSQLDARANQLAHLLVARGVGPDAPVALALDRSVELIVSMLAILKAGGAYVPLDTAYPRERLAQMVEDAQPVLLLSTSALKASLPSFDSLPLVWVDEEDLSSLPAHAPAVPLLPQHLAYILFTSGSTGRPKGVAINHRSVMRTVCNANYADVSSAHTFLLIAPISFDASTVEIWGPLLHGGRLVVYPPIPASDLDTLSDVLKRHSVTTLHLTSGLFSQMVDSHLQGLAPLKQLLTGGDVISAPHVRRVVETLRIPVTACYGPTEVTVFTSCCRMISAEEVPASVPIGTLITATQVYILDAHGQPVPIGVPGELFISGEGLARGYVRRPELTAERFLPDPFSPTPGARMYRAGDLARWRPDGVLEFLGRVDFQVKVRGFRIELAEVEAALLSAPGVREVVVTAREDVPGDKRLVAYVVMAPVDSEAPAPAMDTAALRAWLRQRLPEYMVPSAIVALPALPLTHNGKVNRKALPPPDASPRQGRFVEPGTELEARLVSLWARELSAGRVGVHDHFFEELGGTSLSAVRVASRMREELGREVRVVWLFEHPSIHDLARRLEREGGASIPAALPASKPAPEERARAGTEAGLPSDAIAIIGMAGRFPGAGSTEDFWHNLRSGIESISRFSPEELEHFPDLPEGMELWQHPAFVPASGVLDGIDRFDAAFFDMTPREAQWMDPQQRLFLQCAWHALEDAGIDPTRAPGAISLYAGAGDSGYAQLVRKAAPLDPAAFFEIITTSTHEGLSTKASYKLRLTGESVLVNTACSTGLVAVHMACQNLLSRRSTVAMAGATRLGVPQRTGYVYQEGMIASPDGHCRAFDAKAQGTVAGNGVAAVVLKRLEDALRDGDSIYAVIRATATNNDGHLKSGYTAPSVQGQSEVITEALTRAGVKPGEIGYVEAHGTATPLGDPIEVAALQRAYGLGAEHRGTIALASLKSNVGHLDTVAGLAGLIKVALSLHHGELAPSLHFEQPNPRIDFDAGPFFVNTALRPWPRSGTPRRAAVSSFGIGGTNAHAVLEEAPLARTTPSLRPQQLVLVSARAPEALEAACLRLAAHLEAHPEQPLADVAFTHAVGRRAFEYRHALVARDGAELARRLRQPHTPTKVKDLEAARRRRVAFIFPGQGAQQPGMARELYEAEPAYRAWVDACLTLLEEPLRSRVRALLHADAEGADSAGLLADTRVALPALFTAEYALARTWMDWGVQPYAVLGHSFGEYAAACVAGVLPLEDALRLAVARGELMHRLPPGGMLAIALPEAEVRPLLSGRLSLAAINGPDRCVVSGPVEDMERLQDALKQRNVGAVRMPAPHAFHSADVEPLMPVLARRVATLKRSEPTLRYASSVTGTWARAGELPEPRYWADQMRQPVRFAEAVGALLGEGCGVLLEVGPAQDLTPLVRACLGEDRSRVMALASLRRGGATSRHAGLMQTLGELWASGLEPDWTAFHAHEQRQRLHLPLYPFQEKRCWVELPSREAALSAAPRALAALPHATPTALPEPAALPAPVAASGPVREDAPRGDLEERVAALWRERLGVEYVGRDENFLEAGGNSLTAAQLVTRLRETFGVQLPYPNIYSGDSASRFLLNIAFIL